MLPELSIDDFGAFFEEVHGKGVRPFFWQERLLRSIVTHPEGRWPDLLDLPTGSGKTAAIDVAVFHLALEVVKPRAEMRAPRRIVLVVDRRTVVDQAFERAKRIAQRLKEATDGVLGSVRARLVALSGDEELPLDYAQLRGGMPREDAWARSPIQPLVAVSTVDQVGSRILFRGYGVSDTMRPIHAGLLGNDTLFLLDEVHLARPFMDTLTALQRYRRWHREQEAVAPKNAPELPDRWQVVPMSATAETTGVRFTLQPEDRAHPVLSRRLRASKPVTCVEVKVSGIENVRRRQFAEAVAKRAVEETSGNRAVGVVVNRVATALEVYDLVRQMLASESPGAQVELATGRMRPLDRAELDRKLQQRISSSERDRSKDVAPLVVVATQCIEAGADYDFDVLVTECASLDALRQRFGRLNRLGRVEAPTPGFVFARSDALIDKAVDPIYGEALKKTWAWLVDASPDFGIEALDAALSGLVGGGEAKDAAPFDLSTMLPRRATAPVMFSTHLDAWAQTSQIPAPDPDISFWLHGKEERVDADVQIVWRADIEAALAHIDTVADTPAALESLRTRVELCPPNGLEAVAVPIEAARAWLLGPRSPSARTTAADFGDVDGVPTERDDGERSDARGRPALAWLGEKSDVVYAKQLRPGMTIVVPTSYGGLRAGTWDPSSDELVSDRGDEARWTQTKRPVLRLHPAVMAFWPTVEAPPPQPTLDDETMGEERELLAEWLIRLAPPERTWLRDVVDSLRSRRQRWTHVRVLTPESSPESVGFFGLIGRRTTGRGGGDASTESDGSSMTGVEVPLTEHMRGVASLAQEFARGCGLDERYVAALRVAAWWHDAGKVDPRFQRWLHGGSPLAEVAAEPLAKSKMLAADRKARERARERSGYPRGGRHELSSLALLENGARLLEGVHPDDRDLVLHLVASHHGWCRPFAPVVHDPEPVDLTLDVEGEVVTVRSAHGYGALGSGVAERFWALTEKHGWFGLAWLETLLRLADHRRSELEQHPAAGDDEGRVLYDGEEDNA